MNDENARIMHRARVILTGEAEKEAADESITSSSFSTHATDSSPVAAFATSFPAGHAVQEADAFPEYFPASQGSQLLKPLDVPA